MGLLFLQVEAPASHQGVGPRVHEIDWGRPFFAPRLTAEWLAKPFQEQLGQVSEWVEDIEAVIGFGWGAHLLLCALESAAQLGHRSPKGLFFSCFFNRGQFTGHDGKHYRLPRAETVRSALLRNGVLADADFRFVHGLQDTAAPVEELEFLSTTSFPVQRVRAGHRLLGPGQEAVQAELLRLQRSLRHREAHSSLVETSD